MNEDIEETEGWQEGYDAGHELGWDDGYEEGKRDAEREARARIAELEKAVAMAIEILDAT